MSMQDAFDAYWAVWRAKAGLAPDSPKQGSAEPLPSAPHPTTLKPKRKLPSPINLLMSSAADENAVPGPDAPLEGRPPTDPAKFAEDPRISWSQLDNAWILEREDGEELKFDTTLKRWILDVSNCVNTDAYCFVASKLSKRDCLAPVLTSFAIPGRPGVDPHATVCLYPQGLRRE